MGRLIEQRGFTLVELMVTVAIAAILMAIAIPSFQGIRLNSQQTNRVNQFAAMIGRGRSEAVTRAKSIVACASSNSMSAAPSCSGVNTWQTGWILFADLNGNGAFNVGDVLLQTGEPLAAGVTVRGIGFGNNIVFAAGTGLLTTGGGLRYCDARGFANIRVLNVGISGQVRIAIDGNNDGTVEDGAGTEVVSC